VHESVSGTFRTWRDVDLSLLSGVIPTSYFKRAPFLTRRGLRDLLLWVLRFNHSNFSQTELDRHAQDFGGIMRKLALLFTALAFNGSAFAADMAVKAPPPPPVFSWTGCYVGGNLGGGWTHKHFEFTDGGQLFDEGTLGQGGFIGGGQLGCDYQFGSNFVVGVQGMFDGTTIKGTETFFSGIDQFNEQYAVNLHWFTTLTGRVGFLATPSLLLYGKGGAAWVNERINYVPGVEVVASTGNTTRSGWDAGAGIEWMFAPNGRRLSNTITWASAPRT
jgi:outer membrane immunogenic protein